MSKIKGQNKLKTLIALIISVLILSALVIKVIAIDFSGETEYTNTEAGGILNENGIYCIQEPSIIENVTYMVSKHNVNDNKITYIFNHNDSVNGHVNSINGPKNDRIQRLLWYYIKNGGKDSIFKDAYVKEGSFDYTLDDNNKTAIWKNSTIYIESSESTQTRYFSGDYTVWKDAEKYSNLINNDSERNGLINITSMQINGNKVVANWTKTSNAYDGFIGNKYDIYISSNGTDYTLYRNNYSSNAIEIDLNQFGENATTAYIKIASSQKKYSASYYLLEHNSWLNNDVQDLISIETGITNEPIVTSTKSIPLNTNVSLQKYITNIKSKGDATTRGLSNVNETTLVDRKNTYTAQSETATGANRVVSKTEQNAMKAQGTYKRDNVVNIEVGDEVTYRVWVYNNSKVNAKKVYVRDRLHLANDSYEITKITQGNNTQDIKANWQLKSDTTGYAVYEYLLENLAGETNTYFDITIKFTKYVESSAIINSAFIQATEPNNSTEYRTVDRDYVKMKEYSVALEKYITKVTDSFGNNEKTYDNRAEKRYNVSAQYKWSVKFNNTKNMYGVSENGTISSIKGTDKSEERTAISNSFDNGALSTVSGATVQYNKNPFKTRERNYVKVEPGDLVTFTVKLLNSGEGRIKIPYIDDAYSSELEFKSVTDNNGNTIGVKSAEKLEGTSNTYRITFNNPIELEKRQSTEIKLVFSVNIQKEETTAEHTLTNVANVPNITNKNDIDVPDSDEEENNKDQDTVITQTYAVSLEKFVYKVNDYELLDFNKDGNIDDKDVTALGNYNANNTIDDKIKDRIVKYADLSGDGKVDVSDGSKLQSLIVSMSYDFNNDLKVNNEDVILLQKYVGQYQLDNDVKTKIEANEDITSDGIIDSNDVTQMQKKLYKLRENNAEHCYDEDTSTNDDWKYNNIVTVSKNDKVTYTIKLTNNGKTKVYITNIADYLPDGVNYNGTNYNGGQYNTQTDNRVDFNNTASILLEPGEATSFEVNVTVIESNMSLNVLKNVAEITDMENRNKLPVKDTTPKDNIDADYLKLNYPVVPPPDGPGSPYIPLSGMVWIDKNNAKDNSENGYNGLYESGEAKKEGITVKLYRTGLHEKQAPIATTTTNDNGAYFFQDKDIKADVVTAPEQRYIKGPKTIDETTKEYVDRWTGQYYSYYIVFEYDGITYTSTPDGKSCVAIADNSAYSSGNYKINSNAKEEFNKRKAFNDKFKTINNDSGIEYETVNENNYIPQSKHKYNINTMTMSSSTETIDLSKGYVNNSETAYLDQIKYVNLGLRGRDIFDLELTSDVAQIDIRINGINQTYKYSNKITVRKSDLTSNTNITEDMANTVVEQQNENKYVGNTEQKIRNSDKTHVNSIYVMYKITVQNTSKTNGTATYITNYYDNNYDFTGAYSNIDDARKRNSNKLGLHPTANGTTDKGYSYKTIETGFGNMTQSETKDIYVVYKLKKSGISNLSGLETGKVMPTYNMAEIYEYKTFAKNDDNEYVRGLIDKDSAPGSVKTEKVRLSQGESNLSTVDYYFNKQELNKLKYEDDTYATPTLYLTIDGKQREISGNVFEDITGINSDKVKSGNGIKDVDENGNDIENGVFGVTVILKNDNNKEVARTTSDENGDYSFKNFIPGNYTIEYKYGDTKNTVLMKQKGDKNAKSYNGEDFQSTNNSENIEGLKIGDKEISVNILKKLSGTSSSYWYLFNETRKVSVANDIMNKRDANENGRNDVSRNVASFTDAEMISLNNIREGVNVSDDVVNSIINKTNMTAKTDNFKITVEKSTIRDENIIPSVIFGDYNISGMNFGISKCPVTTIDLQKHVNSFKIKDAAGENTIAEVEKKIVDGKWNGEWNVKEGNILTPVNTRIIDVSIEDEKLQGARLDITYDISSKINIEKDFRNREGLTASISKLVDLVDNDLSYDDGAGVNAEHNYWKISNAIDEGDRSIKGEYAIILEATNENPIINSKTGDTVQLTLSKVLSSLDASVSDIITSAIDTYEYDNTVEILGIDYTNSKIKINDKEYTMKDRIRKDGYVLLAGKQHDSASSETVSIHPPTGNDRNIVYYVVAVSALVVLAVGVVLVKKYAIKKD